MPSWALTVILLFFSISLSGVILHRAKHDTDDLPLISRCSDTQAVPMSHKQLDLRDSIWRSISKKENTERRHMFPQSTDGRIDSDGSDPSIGGNRATQYSGGADRNLCGEGEEKKIVGDSGVVLVPNKYSRRWRKKRGECCKVLSSRSFSRTKAHNFQKLVQHPRVRRMENMSLLRTSRRYSEPGI